MTYCHEIYGMETPWAKLEDILAWPYGYAEIGANLEYVIYVATSFFATRPDDNPRSTPFRGVLRQAFNIKRSILGGNQIGVFTTADGSLEFDNADAFYDFLTQDFAVDGREVIIKLGRKGDPYSGFFTLFRGTAKDWSISEASVDIQFRDRAYLLDVPAQPNTYGGTGGADGGADVAGKRKPRAFGVARNVSPVLVVPSALIYQVNDGPVEDITAVYERGSSITKGDDYATYALLAAASTSAGQYDTCLAEGFFKLETEPQGTVTADVEGDASGDGYVETTADVVRRIVSSTTTIVDPDDLFASSFTALNTAQPAPIGYWLDPEEELTVADVVARIMAGIGGWAGFRRDGTFEVRRLEVPSGTPVARFTRADIFDIKREPPPASLSPPPWRHRIAYGRSWTQQTDLAGSVSATHRAFVAEPYRLAEASAASILVDHPLAQDLPPVEAYFAEEADALAEAERRLAFYRTVRVLYRAILPRRSLRLNLGEVTHFTFPRWDLGAGRLVVVVEMNESLSPPSRDSVDTVEVVAYG